MGRRVLITGVGSFLGTELARRLETDPDFEYVAGVDDRAPRARLERTEFVEADIRSPIISRIVPQLGVDTIVHNKIVRRPGPTLSAQAAHDINVIGTLQLLTACEKADTLSSIVIRGSAGIYGSEPAAPQFFTEDMSRLYPLRTRFQRDVAEIENYFETFSRRHPAITCTMLRFEPAIGPTLDTQITRYLSLPIVPTYFGFDPRLQFVHEVDAIEATVAAIKRPVRGAVNVAGAGTVGLTKLVRAAGKLTFPIVSPLFGGFTSVAKRAGLLDFSDDFSRLLHYGRAVDITRLTEEVGFTPNYSTPDAVEDYVRTLGGRRLAPPLRQVVAR
jgi:UDP-glucose 4-epimerase